MRYSFQRLTGLAIAAAAGVVLTAGCTSSPTGPVAAENPTTSAAAAAPSGITADLANSVAAPGVSPSAIGSAPVTAAPPPVTATAPVATGPVEAAAATTGSNAATTGGSSSYTGGTQSPAPQVSIPPRATTPVPAPGGGNIKQIVPNGPRSTQAPAPVAGTATYGNGITVKLGEIKKLETTPQLPGEIGGPGVAVAVTIRNGSTNPIDLSTVTVDLQDATGVPASPMSADPAKPVGGQLAAGATTTGTYVYSFPPNYRSPDRLTVSYSAQAPVVLFTGTIS